MQNESQWQPTKFERHRGGWRASRDPAEVGIGSRIITDLVCETYSKALVEHARGRTVDLGCGKVPLYGIYRSHVSEVVCVDWPGSLHSTPHIDHYADLNARLPFEDGGFDTVVCTDVVEHVWDHANLFSEMARILRPGGKAIIATPFMYWLHEEPYDYFRWTPHALRAGCRDAGLDPIELHRIGGAPEVIADILGKVASSAGPRLAKGTVGALSAMLRLHPVRKLSERLPQYALSHLVVAARPAVSS